MKRSPTYPPSVIHRLLDWCEANADCDPEAVVTIGLAYACFLNEHQIAHATAHFHDGVVQIAYPDTRRPSALSTACEQTTQVRHPPWLVDAITALTHGESGALFRCQRQLVTTVSGRRILDHARRGTRRATGHLLTPSKLAAYALAEARGQGLAACVAGIGYAAATEALLIGETARTCRRASVTRRR